MARTFTVFGTLATAVRVYARNFVSITILAVLVYAPLIACAVYGLYEAGTAATKAERRDAAELVIIVMCAGTYLLSKVLAGAVGFAVFNQLRGTKVSFGACVTNGIRRLIPVILTCLVLIVLIGIATAAYVLPGIVAICLTYVAVPSAVIEGGGPFKAFARSVKLVDKDMPRVFVLLFVFAGIQVALYWGLMAALGALGVPVVALVVFMAMTILFGAFDAVLSSVAYANLRVDRDGIIAADLANVFD